MLVDFDILKSPDTPPCTGLVLDSQPYISCGATVMTIRDNKPHVLGSLAAEIRWMEASLPRTLPRLLLGTDEGMTLVTLGQSRQSKEFGQEHSFTHASFMACGRVVATTPDEVFVYENTGNTMRLLDCQPMQFSNTLAVLPLSAETFGVVYRQGLMQRWRIT